MPDILAGIGFISLVAGIFMVLGIEWTLIITGALMLVTGFVAAWRRHRT